MSPPLVLVNSLMQDEGHAVLDPITQVFIKAEAAVGINRLHLLDGLSPCSKKLFWIAGIYCNVMVIFCAYISDHGRYHIKTVLDLSAYFFNVIFSFITCDRLKLYFHEIDTFDKAVGCRPKYSQFLKHNIMLHIMVLCVMAGAGATFFIRFWHSKDTFTHIIIIHVQRTFELYFYAHLFCIIDPRLKLINFYVSSSRTNSNDTVCVKPKGFEYFSQAKSQKDFTNVKFLMDLYQILVTAHRNLVNAIKWQFLFTIISSFGITLATSYQVASQLLQKSKEGEPPVDLVKLLPAVFFVGGNVLCLVVPCAHRDLLQAEVQRLRSLLASRLYEDDMDKRSRTLARALLSLTQQHSLGVSLLGMVQVDISLPLHYVSLLVTYLIILLQFQKVNRA